MSLSVHGWSGHGDSRLAIDVEPGACAAAEVPSPGALLRRVAGLEAPALWVRVAGRDVGRLPAHARPAAGLATLDGRPPVHGLTVRDLLLAGRPLPGRAGFLGLGHNEAAEEREATARALAGRLGLGPVFDGPVAALDGRAALLADLGRALLADPVALVAAPPAALARDLIALLREEVARSRLAACVLLPGTLSGARAAAG